MNPETQCEITCMDVAPLSEEKLFSLWMNRMPESRKRKAASLRHAESQRLSLGVGILLFQALEKRGIDGTNTEIREGKYGRPFLPEYPEIHFSLSHAGKWALCAVCGCPVGCDAECFGRGKEGIVRRFFHPEEQEALSLEKNPGDWDRLFTRLWTRKESYLKATGRGLSLPMNSFSAVTGGKNILYDTRDTADGYAFSCCVLEAERAEFAWKTVNADCLRL